MKIIDFHAHIYPEKVSEKAVESIGKFYNINMKNLGTASDLLKQGEEYNVANYVVHSVAVDAKHVEVINNFILEQCTLHEKFYGFGTMHADYLNKLDEIERFSKLGLRGVKIHPDTQKFHIDDERMFEVYDYLSEKNIPLLIHTGDYRYPYSHPEKLKKVLKLFPKLTAIGAHFGGWSIWDLALEYLKDTNCYLDSSSSIAMIGTVRANELINIYGAERILFGTDFPMWRLCDELAYFDKMNLTDKQRELIFYKNAERLLNISED